MPSADASPNSRRLRQVVAAVFFAASIALNAWTLRVALRIEPVETTPVVTWITDPAELAGAQHDIGGTYTTGERFGDRVITIDGQGGIRFYEIGVGQAGSVENDTYQLGRVGKSLWLITTRSGAIEVGGIDTLTYYEDRYNRVEKAPLPSDVPTPPASRRRAPRVAAG